MGTGLGLWLSHSIVERHGGKLRMRSSTAAGRSGTAFSFFIPLELAAVIGEVDSMGSMLRPSGQELLGHTAG